MQSKVRWFGVLGVIASMIFVIGGVAASPSKASIAQEPFGTMPDGVKAKLYTLRNAKGVEVKISDFGGIVVSLKVPDRNGKFDDVVLGYDNVADYIKDTCHFGGLIGRYCNRIAFGKFTLDGKQYTLATNNGPNHLHGGIKGFDKKVWNARAFRSDDAPSLELCYVSKDGEEGYPGNLSVTAVYTLTEDNTLKLEIKATTDKPTVCNLTNHSYFNLAGKGDILGHEVMILADKFTPVDSGLIPTGELRPVDGTPFDFRTSTPVGARINNDDEQLKLGKGYDHNWVIRKPLGEIGPMARLYEPTSGRLMEVWSTQPGVQFYTGNFLDGSVTGKGGWVYQLRNGLCFEPQHYPDSPNKPGFPSVVLRPGEVYKNTIVYRFSVKQPE